MDRKRNETMRIQRILIVAALAAVVLAVPTVDAARKPKRAAGGSDTVQGKRDFKANDMLSRGVALLEEKQEDRGLKLIESVIKSYPDSVVRFKAHIAMGDYQQEKRSFDLAVKQFLAGAEAESDDIRAEATYKAGICYYSLNQHDKAFVTLRKVTRDYPWSVYANEAYYYIGLCHFKLKRWSRAFEALELVGTSVPVDASREVLAEAGQRFFVKVEDQDLIVARETGTFPDVRLVTKSGDSETMTLAPLGKSGNVFIGSIMTQPGVATAGDSQLQTIGGDTLSITYVDENTESGTHNVKRLGSIRFVSSAAIGFVDGAYREYRKGLFGDQDAFIRVRDLDRDTTPQPDQIDVEVRVQYKEKKVEDEEKTGVSFDDEETITVRCSARVILKETGPHTGMFVGSVPIEAALDDGHRAASGSVWAMKDDEAVLLYTDSEYMGGNGARTLDYSARVVIGDIQDVKIEHREIATLDLKARKDLIEARILLKLAEIFKEVGLNEKAYSKADEALERANAVVSASLQGNLERSILEEAYSAKWNLLIVKDDLNGAIRVCSDLIRMFPESSLVDRALMKIAAAKIASGRKEDLQDATRILASIQRLPKSDMKAEAQFMMAELAEQSAIQVAKKSRERNAKPDFSRAMTMYKRCADLYPESLFAGRSLEKICNYYINVTKDYGRATQLLEQVFQDYPDASFLDGMLYRWVQVAYKSGQYQVAADKCAQLLTEYPESASAKKALKDQAKIAKMLGE
jgi:TolA-binding protein